MKIKIGFIGAGNMGGAMIGGILNSNFVSSSDLYVFDVNAESVKLFEDQYSIQKAKSSVELARLCDWIIVAVKPNIYPVVLEEIKTALDDKKVLISIAAGVTLEQMEDIVGSQTQIVRTMPNTPALVRQGMAAICPNTSVTPMTLEHVQNMFTCFGKAEVVKESLIDAVIGVSGSAPAYVFMMVEAMADAAVLGGMPRQMAYTFAAQTVLGSAQMVLETGKHPGELKDMVCSPGGTTIEAVRSLESTGFRASLIDSIVQCMDKSKRMSEK